MKQQQIFKFLMIFTIFSLAAFAWLAFEFDFLWEDAEIFWLVLLIAACIAPVVFVYLSGSFDPFEPVYPVVISTFVYYGLMVIVLLPQGDSFWMLNINYRSELPKVLFLALLALASFYMGYYGWGRNVDQLPQRPAMTKADIEHVHRWSIVIIAFSVSLFILWIVIARVPLWSLWIFGEASYNTWKTEAEGVQLGYLLSGLEALPACALLYVATRSKSHWPWTSMLLLSAITILVAGLGIRYRLLLVLGSSFVFFYLERGKRPSIWRMVLAGFIVFYFIAGLIGYARDPENPGRALTAIGLTDAWVTFVKSSEIATATAVFVRWTPVFGYELGKNILEVLLIPIPTFLWPGKYQFIASPIVDYQGAGAAAAFFTDFYVSFGPAGVVLGMALLGWLCRRVYDTYKENPTDPFAQITLALLWPYLFHVYGRNLVSQLIYNMVYVFGPVWISKWLVTRRQRNPKQKAYRYQSAT